MVFKSIFNRFNTTCQALILIGCVCASSGPSFASTILFTDWQSVDVGNDIATGVLGSVPVTFSGTEISSAVLDESSTLFDEIYYSPALTTSDYVEFRSNFFSRYNYNISFGSSVTDPLIHLNNSASTLDFTGISLVKISGESTFIVSGSSVTGALFPSGVTTSGTIQLLGTFNSIDFTATTLLGGPSSETIRLQIGAAVVPIPGHHICK